MPVPNWLDWRREEYIMSEKTNRGNYFEDFRIGMTIVHATPRTVTDGDVSLYTALYGSRFPVQSSSCLRPSHWPAWSTVG